ncbi:hypothetical protein F4781DRAFT_136254 [Annulohypoxylon bovei var. microspora]|nr:hypothetical protein F4781DRAFT_136254 [Annulohypoxylon bovei var. microspora]
MTYWEDSQSPPRHSTHHHRRHHQPRDGDKSYQVSNDRPCLKHPRKQHKSDLAIANSNRTSQPQTRYDIVENWLAQTARQSPHPYPRASDGHRKEDADNHHPSRPLNAIAPYNKHPRPVDQKWSPRHGFPIDSLPQSVSPFRDLGMRDPRKSTRRRTTPSDSSFISGFGNTTKPPDHGPGPIPQAREKIPPARSPREAGLAPPDASSITSHVDEQMNFEKRPRRKTRDDKYETKKKKQDHEKGGSGGYEDHRRKKRKKAEKRKSMISSKNVVNNFASNAVLNDRITVQPHLKPGLFDNGRTSKKQPISDLAFSEMQFLKHQKRNPQPKPLSKSRVREKRREDREMEEVSSFFLPHGADRNIRTPKPHDPSSRNDYQDIKYKARQFPSTRFQRISKLSPSGHRLHSGPVHISQPRDETVESLSLNSHGFVDDGKDSGKNTAYFTWSTSRHSPQTSKRANSSSPDMPVSVWSTTPEPVRRDLIATGIYRDTGIPSYDDHLTEHRMKRRKIDSGKYNSQLKSENNIRSPPHGFNGTQKVKYRDQAIMTEYPMTCSESPLETQKMGGCRTPRSQEQLNPQISHVAQEVDRQTIARDVRLSSPKKGDPNPNVRTPDPQGTKSTAIHQSPGLAGTNVGRNVEGQSQEKSDQVSVTSRDVMPPPPIPPSGNNSDVSPDANIGEINPPRQNVPSTNTETENLQARHIVSHNNVTQDTQGLPESCNQIAPSSESTVNNEHMLSSFDTASWIPQRTPSARTAETHSIISRTSIKSPFYVDQYEKTLSRNSYRKDPAQSRGPENIAEFIARIERESQQQSLLCDDDTLGSESGLEKVAQDPSIFDGELFDEQPSIYDERVNVYSHLDPNSHLSYTDVESSRIDQLGGGEYYIEAQYPQYDIGVPKTLPDVTQSQGDFEEEHFEMSSFWRPNQFFQF